VTGRALTSCLRGKIRLTGGALLIGHRGGGAESLGVRPRSYDQKKLINSICTGMNNKNLKKSVVHSGGQFRHLPPVTLQNLARKNQWFTQGRPQDI